MPKTCRNCGADWVYCAIGFSGEGRSCWIPSETPSLVDELATVGELLLEKMDNIGDGMLRHLDILDARELLRKALACHKKEVGDAERTHSVRSRDQ